MSFEVILQQAIPSAKPVLVLITAEEDDVFLEEDDRDRLLYDLVRHATVAGIFAFQSKSAVSRSSPRVPAASVAFRS